MLYYCKNPEGNFGDDLNPWLWSRLAPETCDLSDPTLFVAIGTILSRKLAPDQMKVVFGAGCGYKRPPVLDRNWVFYAVRGPLTAARLNLKPELVLTDPALLVRSVWDQDQKKRYPVAFMPHHKSMLLADWPALCAKTSIHCIDPRAPLEQILSELGGTELLLAEAMHGAVVADALRIPWIPVRMYSQFLEFKWLDWTQSMGLPFNVASIPPIFQHEMKWRQAVTHAWKKAWGKAGLGKEKWKRLQIRKSDERQTSETLHALERLASSHGRSLSSEEVVNRMEMCLRERLEEMRTAWRRKEFCQETSQRRATAPGDPKT